MLSQLLFIEEAKYSIPVCKAAAHKPQLMFPCVEKKGYLLCFLREHLELLLPGVSSECLTAFRAKKM